jgi:hypothetical protein
MPDWIQVPRSSGDAGGLPLAIEHTRSPWGVSSARGKPEKFGFDRLFLPAIS